MYVVIGWREMVSETFRVQGGVAPPLRPGGHWRVSLPPRPLRPRPLAPLRPATHAAPPGGYGRGGAREMNAC